LYKAVSDRYDVLRSKTTKKDVSALLAQAKVLLKTREDLEKEISQMIEYRNKISPASMNTDHVSIEALDIYIAIKNKELEALGGKAVKAPELSQENQNLLAVTVNSR